MEINKTHLEKLAKIAGFPGDPITFEDSINTKKYIREKLQEEEESPPVFAIAKMRTGEEIVFSYNCDFEKAAKFLQEVTKEKIDSVTTIKKEFIDKNDLYINIIKS